MIPLDGFLHFPGLYTTVAFRSLCRLVISADRNIRNTAHGSDSENILVSFNKCIRYKGVLINFFNVDIKQLKCLSQGKKIFSVIISVLLPLPGPPVMMILPGPVILPVVKSILAAICGYLFFRPNRGECKKR